MEANESLPAQVDVAIIGSGVVGLFTAYHLAQAGTRHVAVFDRGPIGGVASPRAGGMLRHHYAHPLLVELAVRGHEFYRRFQEHTGHDAGYVQNGYLLGVDADHGDWLTSNVEMVRSHGVDTEMISPRESQDLISHMDPEGWSGPIAYDRSAAYIQPAEVMRGLANAVRRLGATILPGVAVSQIDVVNGQVTGVWTETGQQVKADVVINAAGAWGAKVAALVGVNMPVEVRRLLQIFEIRPDFPVDPMRLSFSDGPLDLYSRPNPGNRLLVGSRHYFDAPQDPDRVDLRHTPEDIANTRGRYASLIPDASDATVYQAWAGIDGDTPDFQPILGAVPGIEGFIVGVGLSAHGFKLGPIIGQLLAELIIYGQYRTVDVRSLGLERFATGQLFPRGYKQMGA